MAEQPPEVPLADVEIAQRIAAGARGGRKVDREPTLEQLLAAFGEPAATPQARARVAAALRVAGVRVAPDLLLAPPGTRVRLDAGAARRPVGRLLGALLALAVLIGGAAAAAVLVGNGDDSRVADLPDTTTQAAPATTTATTDTSAATTGTGPTATATTPAATETTTVGTTTASTATTTTKKRTPARKKKARKRPTTVRARLTASQPTYLCVKDGTGRQLFGGTLTGSRVFRAKVLRLNVGLGSTTTVVANGRRVPLTGSPAGVELRPGGRVTVLGSGQRPEC